MILIFSDISDLSYSCGHAFVMMSLKIANSKLIYNLPNGGWANNLFKLNYLYI
jgi:hypothetical protein